jgi:glycosyltransferase involved in cell wall biosynthesis
MKYRRIALIHDWYTVSTGSEKVVEQILALYPNADLFSLVDFLPDEQRKFLNNRKPYTSFIQHLPFARQHYRNYIGLMPLAIEQFNLSSYDMVISSCHAVAKGVITGPDQLHISYIHSPLRYVWDMKDEYLNDMNMDRGIRGWVPKLIFHYIRLWDIQSINRVDVIYANSRFIARRIEKVYRRTAKVIYPPIDVDQFSFSKSKNDYYLVVSRLVTYKKVDIIVKAFAKMPDKKLIIIGDGPDIQKIKSILAPNITLLGYQPIEKVVEKIQNARALIMASKEDFGMTPVEAQACGTPVIAFGQGGALETIQSLEKVNPTGIFFLEQTPEAICQAVEQFEEKKIAFTPENCRGNALRFSKEYFKKQFSVEVEKAWYNFSMGKSL